MSNDEEPDEGNPHVRFCEGKKTHQQGIRIVRHKGETRKQNLRRNLNTCVDLSTRLIHPGVNRMKIEQIRMDFERWVSGEPDVIKAGAIKNSCLILSFWL